MVNIIIEVIQAFNTFSKVSGALWRFKNGATKRVFNNWTICNS